MSQQLVILVGLARDGNNIGKAHNFSSAAPFLHSIEHVAAHKQNECILRALNSQQAQCINGVTFAAALNFNVTDMNLRVILHGEAAHGQPVPRVDDAVTLFMRRHRRWNEQKLVQRQRLD
ncbi:hypothetical protein SDC9_154907 [bioreactor metagenome]|uniref:Uncharacterized protein n=1 Tax=bioreactor metagenome TaxID=1076179 RepID=A0A645F1V2_9ZZZZ